MRPQAYPAPISVLKYLDALFTCEGAYALCSYGEATPGVRCGQPRASRVEAGGRRAPPRPCPALPCLALV